MNCFSALRMRFLFWLNWDNIPESERSILSDLEKIGKYLLLNKKNFGRGVFYLKILCKKYTIFL